MARKRQETLAFFPEVVTVTRKLSDAQFGALMRAAFAYRFDNTSYSGDDAAVDMAFQFVANQIDRMAEISETNAKNARSKKGERNTAESTENNPNQTESRESSETQKKHGQEDEKTEIPGNPPPSPYPCPSPYPNPSPNVVVADNISATAATRELRLMGGQLGKGKVVLSNAQIEALIEKIGLDMFDYYVDKLSAFIIKNDAKVKNHYETILKWWREDSEAGK